MDYLLNVLLQIEEDIFFDRQRKLLLWKRNSRERKEGNRHESGLKIPLNDITVSMAMKYFTILSQMKLITHNYNPQRIDDMTWKVKSQTGSSPDHYLVVNTTLICQYRTCTVKCTQCNGLCRHTHTCQCYDYKNGHICKHIHAVAVNCEPRPEPVQPDCITTANEPCSITSPDVTLKENMPPGNRLWYCTTTKSYKITKLP